MTSIQLRWACTAVVVLLAGSIGCADTVTVQELCAHIYLGRCDRVSSELPCEFSVLADTWSATFSDSALGQDEGGGVVVCPPGGDAYPVYGTNVYGLQSSICTAAVHAGLISTSTGGSVLFYRQPGTDQALCGSAANGVNSEAGTDLYAYYFPDSPNFNSDVCASFHPEHVCQGHCGRCDLPYVPGNLWRQGSSCRVTVQSASPCDQQPWWGGGLDLADESSSARHCELPPLAAGSSVGWSAPDSRYVLVGVGDHIRTNAPLQVWSICEY